MSFHADPFFGVKRRSSIYATSLEIHFQDARPCGNLSRGALHKVLTESQAGRLIFSEVVRRLLEVGVESYFCDLATGEETFYMSDGGTHCERMNSSPFRP